MRTPKDSEYKPYQDMFGQWIRQPNYYFVNHPQDFLTQAPFFQN